MRDAIIRDGHDATNAGKQLRLSVSGDALEVREIGFDNSIYDDDKIVSTTSVAIPIPAGARGVKLQNFHATATAIMRAVFGANTDAAVTTGGERLRVGDALRQLPVPQVDGITHLHVISDTVSAVADLAVIWVY